MKNLVYQIIVVVASISILSCTTPEAPEIIPASVYEGIEFEMPKVVLPSFPDYSVNIKDYGAIADGKTLNTEAINKAIDEVSSKGGGKVIIPRGMWLTGPIIFKSNVNLHTEVGSFILFTEDKDQYAIVQSTWEGEPTFRTQSPLTATKVENIAITGKGIFDGSGDAWRHVKKGKMTEGQWNELVASGGVVREDGKVWYPSASFKAGEDLAKKTGFKGMDKPEDYAEIKDFLRPKLLHFFDCKTVLLQGITFQNSASWNVHPEVVENLAVVDVSIRNPWYSQNGDGLDIESCKNVVVYNSTFDVGDDAICIKSGKNEAGRKRGIPTENLIIKNCVVYHGHGGVVVGSEMSGGVRNMHASNCTFIGTDVGLRFKSNRNRGGVVENVFISDVDMTNIKTNAISFNLFYGGLSVSEMLAKREKEGDKAVSEVFPITEKTPEFRNIHMKNVKCQGAKQAIFMQGLPEKNINTIYFEDIVMKAKKGLTAIDADSIFVKNLYLETEETPAVLLYNTKNTSIAQVELKQKEGNKVEVYGDKSANISILSKNKDLSENVVKVDDELKEHTIVIE